MLLENHISSTQGGAAATDLAGVAEALERILSGIAQPVIVKDRAHRFVFLNDAACVLLGRPRKDLIGRVDHDLLPKEQADSFWAIDDKVFASGQDHEVEEYITAGDGIIRTLITHKRLIVLPGETGREPFIVAVVSDVTELRRAEAVLRESEEHYRYSVELNPQIPWTADPEGNIIEASSRWHELTGMPVHEALGRGWVAALHPDDLPPTQQSWLRSVTIGEPFDTEYRLRLTNGNYRWFRARATARRNQDDTIFRWYGTLEDIHESKLATQALREREHQLATIFGQTTIGILHRGLNNDVLMVNQRFCDIVGRSWQELDGLPMREFTHPEDFPQNLAVWENNRQNGTPFQIEKRYIRPDGTATWCAVNVSFVRGENDEVVSTITMVEDITERKRAEEHLRWAAFHDSLTELPNRRLFQEQLQQSLQHASHDQHRVGLLIIDLDDFKLINDRFGHDAGDALLKAFAQRLKSIAPHPEMVARLGGDEFSVILPDIHDEAGIARVAEGILAHMRNLSSDDSIRREYRTSIGGAISSDLTVGPDELLKQADIALYKSKAVGPGTFTLFKSVMREEIQQTATALRMARKAVQFDWIVPFYQPKVALDSGALAGFEALLRWRHPQLGIQSPSTIASAFEDVDLGVVIGERMLASIIADIRSWLDAGLDVGTIALNASASEFLRDNYAERLLDQLRLAGVSPRCIEIEVTETVFLGYGAERVEQALRTLSTEGVKIALDDFGTGYASLSHLKKFPVDVIKLDRSFVRNLENDSGDAAIVQSVLTLGRGLDIKVVAEGVETAAQAALLREQGCDLGQGYFFGRPMASEAIPRLIRSWQSSAWVNGAISATA